MSEEKKAVVVETGAENTKTTTKVVRRKKRKKALVQRGIVHIKATFNNTLVAISDKNGNVLGMSSAGRNGFKGPKKATPFAASMIVKDVVERTREYGLQDVDVLVSGVGAGREGAIRALNANGLRVLSIKDITPIPHNGCRPPRARRV